ncbi:MAG: MipA/OmpV family protein [Syntrophaceae bacterium]|jgi:MipA family protein|nr:MipA/OmpV family protein [Syntrophaceae bacterium]HOC60207.1 MipA/OmpV family protein [Smithellaceae bacterium]HQM45794.1 MipA/OmpV family protein [Smithellaceae bacterium]
MLKCRAAIMVLALFLLVLPQETFCAEKPLWELGIGGGVLMMPDYRGSDKNRVYALPLPYAVYRGGIFRLEDKRLTARLFRSDRVTLDLSGYGAVPVKSDDNEARKGMQDLDPTFELGPALRVKLVDSAAHQYRLSLALPARAVFSTDFRSVRHEGWVFSPRLNVQMGDVISGTGLTFGASVGPMFADRGVHDYFYEVGPAFSTITRPVYAPGAGYSGSTLTLGLGKNFRRLLFHSFVSADFLQGAVFENSPLVKTKTSWMGGLSVTWIFWTSQKTVGDESIY